MFKTISALNSLLGTLLLLVIVAGLAAGAWFAYHTYYGEKLALERTAQELVQTQQEVSRLSGELAERQKEIQALNVDLAAKKREIERLSTAIRLLKVDHRVAQVDVLWQGQSPETGELATRISFVEVDAAGKAIEKPRVFTLEGNVLHLAALVIKFTDKYVESGDPLRGTSLCLFKRIYGDKQAPEKGFVLDPVGSRPAAYHGTQEMTEWEKGLWAKFWDYSNDPEKALEAGVRAAHGEAVFQEMRLGKRYKVLLRASDGLSIVPEDKPPGEKGGTF